MLQWPAGVCCTEDLLLVGVLAGCDRLAHRAIACKNCSEGEVRSVLCAITPGHRQYSGLWRTAVVVDVMQAKSLAGGRLREVLGVGVSHEARSRDRRRVGGNRIP